MSRLKVPWKDAATIVLAARSSAVTSPTLIGQSLQSADPVNPLQQKQGDFFDYKILLLKRSTKSKFMPSNYVFPGGITHHMDFSSQWHDYFCSSLGINSLHPQKLGLYTGAADSPKPELYSKSHDSILPAEVAYRICAVRETFEESGILLYTDKDTVTSKGQSTLALKTKVPRSVLSQWRDEVNKDEGKFIEMMMVLDILPDIWGLHDWSNWLTPVRWKNSQLVADARRYDTIFYLSILSKPIEEVCDDKEIVASEVCSLYMGLNSYIVSVSTKC